MKVFEAGKRNKKRGIRAGEDKALNWKRVIINGRPFRGRGGFKKEKREAH